jgi:cell division protein FtsW
MIRTENRRSVYTSRPKKRNSVRLGIDVPLLLAIFTLSVFGLIMVYSASWDFSYQEYGSRTYMFTRQLQWFLLSVVVAVFVTYLDYHYWRRLAVPAMMVVVLGLIAVFVVNEVRYGSARTLNEGSFMPSEAAKLVTVIYLSVCTPNATSSGTSILASSRWAASLGSSPG